MRSSNLDFPFSFFSFFFKTGFIFLHFKKKMFVALNVDHFIMLEPMPKKLMCLLGNNYDLFSLFCVFIYFIIIPLNNLNITQLKTLNILQHWDSLGSFWSVLVSRPLLCHRHKNILENGVAAEERRGTNLDEVKHFQPWNTQTTYRLQLLTQRLMIFF